VYIFKFMGTDKNELQAAGLYLLFFKINQSKKMSSICVIM